MAQPAEQAGNNANLQPGDSVEVRWLGQHATGNLLRIPADFAGLLINGVVPKELAYHFQPMDMIEARSFARTSRAHTPRETTTQHTLTAPNSPATWLIPASHIENGTASIEPAPPIELPSNVVQLRQP